MAIEITMPKLSDTMEEGKILRWLKQAGDSINAGDVLAEVETDKADMEVEATTGGVLSELRVAEGESAAVGAVIAVVNEAQGGPPAAASQKAARPGRGSPGGNVEAPPATAGRRELSKMRQSIARRMTEAKREIPHFYLTAEIDMTDAVSMIGSLKTYVEDHITVTHVLLKAVAVALSRHPRVNALWEDGAPRIGGPVHIGVVVAVEDGLIVPVVHGCERRSLRDLAAETDRLVRAAREGKFSGEDLKGGTFSVSNLGMLDVEEFSAVINPPQAAILAVGAIKERPVVRDGQIVARQTLRVTLSCDHRQLDGVEGGRFLETLKGLLQNPVGLVMG